MTFGTSFALFLIIIFFFHLYHSQLPIQFWVSVFPSEKEGNNYYLRVMVKDLDKTQENCISLEVRFYISLKKFEVESLIKPTFSLKKETLNFL